jgi:hypothetical protein
MNPEKSRRTRTTPRSQDRCNYQFADGRRCRMLRHKTTGELCLFHHRALLQLESAEAIGAELLALGAEFNHPIRINFVLGKLFAHVATGRMHRRDASTLAYIAQLLLQTLDQKRYDLARDQHDYRALIPALDLKYGRPKSKRRRSSLGTPTCPGRVSRSAPSTTTTPNTTVRPQPTPSAIPLNADVPDAVRAQYPPPANPEFPEALPDTPWFRQLVLDRRRAAAQASANANHHASSQPTPPARP